MLVRTNSAFFLSLARDCSGTLHHLHSCSCKLLDKQNTAHCSFFDEVSVAPITLSKHPQLTNARNLHLLPSFVLNFLTSTMARKNPAPASETIASDASSAKAQSSTPNPEASGKRKIDWDTIDEDENFDGFTVKPVSLRVARKSSQSSLKKQKTGASSDSAGTESYQHAPFHAKVVQKNPYAETELSEVCCKVEPAEAWECTKRYRKFTREYISYI